MTDDDLIGVGGGFFKDRLLLSKIIITARIAVSRQMPKTIEMTIATIDPLSKDLLTFCSIPGTTLPGIKEDSRGAVVKLVDIWVFGTTLDFFTKELVTILLLIGKPVKTFELILVIAEEGRGKLICVTIAEAACGELIFDIATEAMTGELIRVIIVDTTRGELIFVRAVGIKSLSGKLVRIVDCAGTEIGAMESGQTD